MKILNVLQRFTKCRSAASVRVCTKPQVGGKPQFWSLALEKAIKCLERGKPQSIIRSFATYLWFLWHPLPWHLSPFPQPWLPQRFQLCQPRLTQQSPALEAPNKSSSSRLANPSICCRSRGAGKALLTSHTACCWKFLPSAMAFPPMPHKISVTKEKAIPLSDVLKWCQFVSWLFLEFFCIHANVTNQHRLRDKDARSDLHSK